METSTEIEPHSQSSGIRQCLGTELCNYNAYTIDAGNPLSNIQLFNFDLQISYGRMVGVDRVYDFMHSTLQVKLWLTIHEPRTMTWLGYGIPLLAPGIASPDIGVYAVGHNIIKAHAAAWRTYDKNYRSKQQGTGFMSEAMSL
jgi:Glycosyl hydrolase family 1